MKQVIEKFYESLSMLDADGMDSCYHKDIEFEDPAFGKLRGEQAGNMWRMLCHGAKEHGIQVNYSNIRCDGNTCRAQLEASYVFSRTGRKVRNKIRSTFVFKDGLIIQQTDEFNLYRWSRQALGLPGLLLGWTPFFKKKLNKQTQALLRKYEAKQ